MKASLVYIRNWGWTVKDTDEPRLEGLTFCSNEISNTLGVSWAPGSILELEADTEKLDDGTKFYWRPESKLMAIVEGYHSSVSVTGGQRRALRNVFPNPFWVRVVSVVRPER